MFIYKKDILKELADRGYNCSRMRKEKILGEGTIQNIRKGKGFTLDTLNTICCILRCQPSDIIDIVPSDEEKMCKQRILVRIYHVEFSANSDLYILIFAVW